MRSEIRRGLTVKTFTIHFGPVYFILLEIFIIFKYEISDGIRENCFFFTIIIFTVHKTVYSGNKRPEKNISFKTMYILIIKIIKSSNNLNRNPRETALNTDTNFLKYRTNHIQFRTRVLYNIRVQENNGVHSSLFLLILTLLKRAIDPNWLTSFDGLLKSFKNMFQVDNYYYLFL